METKEETIVVELVNLVVVDEDEDTELFTDAMHRDMFIFQPHLTSRFASTGKPVMKAISTRPLNGKR